MSGVYPETWKYHTSKSLDLCICRYIEFYILVGSIYNYVPGLRLAGWFGNPTTSHKGKGDAATIIPHDLSIIHHSIIHPQPSLWVQAGPLFPHGRTWMQSPHSIPYEANHDSMTITDRGEKYHMLRTYQKPLLHCGRNIPTGLVPFLWTTWSCPTQLPTVNQMLN